MKKLRLGIFGFGERGRLLATTFMLLNCEIVAVCDIRKSELARARAVLGADIATYDSFDSFIEHDMDAVILANFFHEHAPYAIACFARGLHVYSECIANGTMAEGVALLRAHEKSRSIYMLAENYPQMLFNREMKHICEGGTLGKILYAEGEYNHPGNPNDAAFRKYYNYFEGHWRNFLPRTYYITHSLGPLMWATGATPRQVSALAAYAPPPKDTPTASHVGDRAAIVITQNDDGSIFRVTGCAAFGAHHNSYRICGTNGQIENLRGRGNEVMLRYNGWEIPEGVPQAKCYTPEWNDPDEELIKKSGHGGADYLTARMFYECVEKGVQPPHPFDIHSGVTMSSVAILAHRSMLEGGVPYDIPDFHTEEARTAFENDRKTPFPGTDGSAPTIPCCSVTDYAPTKEQVALYKKSLAEYRE